MVKIAEAYVEISASTAKLEQKLKEAVSKAKRGSQAVAKAIAIPVIGAFDLIRQALAKLFGFIGRWAKRLGIAIIAGIGISTKLASDADETESKFHAVFRDLAGAAQRFAKTLANDVGRSIYSLKEGLATFQAFFVGLGFAPRAAAQFAKQMQKVAIDFASFHNISDSNAQQRFIAALSGSSEVLDMFGINVKEAALNQELLDQGFTTIQKGATEQQKAIARIAIILRAMTNQGAMGDAVRTAGSFANQLKRVKASLQELGVAVGRIFTHGGGKGLQSISDVVFKIADAVNRNADMIRAKLEQLMDTVRNVLGFVFSRQTFDVLVGVLAKIVGKIQEIIAAVRTLAQETLKALGLASFQGDLLDFITRAIPAAIIRIRELAIGVIEAIPLAFKGLMHKIRSMLTGETGSKVFGLLDGLSQSLFGVGLPASIAPAQDEQLSKNYFAEAIGALYQGNLKGKKLAGQVGASGGVAGALPKWLEDLRSAGHKAIEKISRFFDGGAAAPGNGNIFANLRAFTDGIRDFAALSGAIGGGIGGGDTARSRAVTQTVATAIGGFTTGSNMPGVREQKKTNAILQDIYASVQNIDLGGVLT